MAHGIWKETKQEPGTAGTGNMLEHCSKNRKSIQNTSIVFVKFSWTTLYIAAEAAILTHRR